jgi:hypothetical protein
MARMLVLAREINPDFHEKLVDIAKSSREECAWSLMNLLGHIQ